MSTDNIFDVTPLVPEAQAIVQQIAQLYLVQFGANITSILVHGSALKGGFIPGCSDIDLKIYCAPGLLDVTGAPPLEQALALQRAQGRLDIAPFQYIQAYIMAADGSSERFKDYAGPVAGAYHMVYGYLSVLEATEAQLLADSHRTLAALPARTSEATQRLLVHGGGRLERTVRWLCTDVWPVLYSVLIVQEEQAGQSGEAAQIWRLSKTAALNMLPRQEIKGRLIRRFYQCLLDYYSGPEQTLEGALTVIEQGILFLRATTQWYEGYQRSR